MSNISRKIARLLLNWSIAPFQLGPHLTRFQMYKVLAKYRFDATPSQSTLSISHSEPLCDLFGLSPTQILKANFPYYDLLNLPFTNEEFDYVVSDQVLEHVQGDPYQAIMESHRVLKQRGYAIHTTCFLNPLHDTPHDYWRFSKFGLELLCRNFSEIVEVGGWGNRKALRMIQNGMRFIRIPKAKWHPLYKIATENEDDWPIVTWIIAKK